MSRYQWTTTDIDSYVAFCTTLGIVDYTVPLRCWANESDNDPTAHDPNGDASGLFQIMPATAKGLGYDVARDPKLALFREMGVAGQLTLAVKYYASERRWLGTVAGFYAVTFLPAMAHLSSDLASVLCGQRGPYAWAYSANKSFDRADKGAITFQDLVDAASRAYGPRAQAIAAAVARRVETQPDLSDLGPADSVDVPARGNDSPDPEAA